MSKKFLLIITVFLGVFVVFADSALSASGVNNVNVTTCEGVTGGVKISRNKGAKYILTNGCRDAGYGIRNYTMSCNSATQYKVAWTENCGDRNDKTPPTVSLSVSQTTSGGVRSVKITANASDNSRVTKTEIYQGAGALMKSCPSSATCNYTVSPSAVIADTRYFARAYDGGGNHADSPTLDIAVSDTVKPTVYLNVDKTQFYEGEAPYFSAGASDDKGVVKMEYVLNGKVLKVCLDVSSCNLTAKLPQGKTPVNYSYMVRAYDAVGNMSSASRSISYTPASVDKIAPVAELSYERVDAGKVNVKVRAYEHGSGITKIEIFKDNTLVKTCTGASTCDYSVSPDSVTMSHDFYAKVYDHAGNIGESKTLLITMYPSGDQIAPGVSLSGSIIGNNYTLNIIVNDSQSRISGLEVFMNNSATPLYSWWDNSNTSRNITKSFTGTLTGGTARFTVKAYDQNGNVGNSAPVYLTSSGTSDAAPAISGEAHTSTVGGVQYVYLSGRASDDYGLSKVEVFWGPLVSDLVMIKRCEYVGTTINETCVSSFPSMFSRSGYYYAVAYDNKNQTSTTMIKSYSFPN